MPTRWKGSRREDGISTSASGSKIYVDGIEVASSSSIFVNNTDVAGKDLSFGVAPSPGGIAPYIDGNIGYLSGLLDDVRIYDYPLSADEVLALYHESGWGASWTNYGVGWPGTNGIPSLVLSADPLLGTLVQFLIGKPAGVNTWGLLFIGFSDASIQTNRDGTLLVLPAFTIPVRIAPLGAVDVTIPPDERLGGLALFAQCLESDAGASDRWSFTPGLELVLGN